jgi:hypothetical protein
MNHCKTITIYCCLFLGLVHASAQHAEALTPYSHSVIYHKNIQLDWIAVTDKTQLQIADDATFTTIVLDTVLTKESLIVSALPKNKKYYWRVRNQCDAAPWQSPLTFVTSDITIYSKDAHVVALQSRYIDERNHLIVENPLLREYELKIYDPKGKLILHQSSNIGQKSLPIHQLKPDRYMISISADGVQTFSEISIGI